jgi:predicted phage terminase large subunit-like protein
MKLFDWQYEVFLNSKAKYNSIAAGRRTGKTQGASMSASINATQGDVVLWVDTVNGNIDRYVERYFLPLLRGEKVSHTWNAQKKVLHIEDSYIDFRSADRPETIEGFGYNKIYLNEAGIILNNEYLFTNSILPMLLDYEDSQLFAFGTPKGQVNKHGDPHRFYMLFQNGIAERGKENPMYVSHQFSSYSNPILSPKDIKEMEEEISKMSPEAVQQEIYAQFVEQSEDRMFNSSEMNFFKMSSIREDLVLHKIGAIDVADEGTDSLSYVIGYVMGKKVYIVDWYFTQDNTEVTIPVVSMLTRQHRLQHLAVETNNHGSMFFKQIYRNITQTQLIGVHQKQNKHSRIVQMAYFIRQNFVFRNDYAAGSNYDIAMKELYAYTKNGKAKHDDAPDSLALLCAMVQDLFPYLWE